jgi:hypothetical protein
MPTPSKKPLKRYLHAVCLPELSADARYFSLAQIRRFLTQHDVQAASTTLLRYLHDAIVDGVIHDAGRGWYSSLAVPFKLNREPVHVLVSLLEKRLPLLEFSCWSTKQVAGYGHLQLARFVAFVHTERDAMESVTVALRDAGWAAWLNPTRQETAKSFRVTENTVIVRPAVSRAPVEGKAAAIEKLLVDLCVESASMHLLDAGEYQRLVGNLAGNERISVGTLAHYAMRRNLTPQAVLPGVIK